MNNRNIVKLGKMEENRFHDAKRLKTSRKLYICTNEEWSGYNTAFVVRFIEFDDLLRSAQPRPMPTARRLAVLPGSESQLPNLGGCCVLGSKIYFAGGLSPGKSDSPFSPPCKFVWSFDTKDLRPGIIRLPEILMEGKEKPVMFDFAGKIYILGTNRSRINFEVFDPDMDTSLPLPSYRYPASGFFPFSYCLAGSKLFVCNLFSKYLMMSRRENSNEDNERMNVISFDLADKDAEWKPVPSMCKGKPFPFTGQGLLLDVQQLDPNKKLLFGIEMVKGESKRLVVYIMSLEKDREDITEIYKKVLPPEFPDVGKGFHLFHLGGNLICLVNCIAYAIGDYVVECYKTAGAAMLFSFDIKEKEKEHSQVSIDVTFQPACRFGFEGLPQECPSMNIPPVMLGCFLL